jgi:hypothetical protein
MTTDVTLEQLEAKRDELTALIAQFRAQPPRRRLQYSVDHELQPGERYAGLLLGADGTPGQHLVLLPGLPGKDLAWPDAQAWAASVGGELPTRREQSLLFANLKGEFEAACYWSSEPHETNGSYAWLRAPGPSRPQISRLIL